MRTEFLYEPFSFRYDTVDEMPVLMPNKHFFELVYILSGKGRHCINQHEFEYGENHMFLITPQDCSRIDITETTTFFILRFSNIYLKKNAFSLENIQRLEFILQHANHKPGCILRNQSDKKLIRPMVEAIIRESAGKDLYDQEIIRQLVQSIILIVARNIAKYLPEKLDHGSEEKIIDIIHYIQQHIYEPEALRTASIAGHFGLSENYLGKYFKKHCNETLQSYTGNYKLTLIEHRLKHSDKRINEIVSELGFNDESHLNKFFRQKKGVSPRQYRQASQKA
ncbi:AraC family transcriptional regulator [Chitinophaga deserti]|uniref:AraC family transcriptional regulator n=1 Tax=Chitinophaga deserti TaxID=2164099 RepID=UPI000D6B236E|nr:AraC family transcriptional regulator [Chitinophaga deserti]